MDPTLASLLLDLTGLSDEEAEELVYREYAKLYNDRPTKKGFIGVRKTHDGQDVLFAEWRFDHAFFESAHKTSRRYNKGKFSRRRGERVRWIGEIIAGNIMGCECYYIPDQSRRNSAGKVLVKRLYVLFDERYLVWLEPRENGQWWFSSAYVALGGREYIRRLTNRRACFWRKR